VSFRRHLVRWEDEYAARGLAVVEVSGGALASFQDSARRLARANVKHPVLWDRNNSAQKAYGVNGWPAAFLVGPDGKVFWQGNPALLRGRRDDERALRESLELQLRKLTLTTE
jgi:hypothetical protein